MRRRKKYTTTNTVMDFDKTQLIDKRLIDKDNNISIVNPKFLTVFSEDELIDIITNAAAVTRDCIVIWTEANFFELSADTGDTLDIYCDDNNNTSGRQLTKDEFMKLHKSSPLLKVNHFNID